MAKYHSKLPRKRKKRMIKEEGRDSYIVEQILNETAKKKNFRKIKYLKDKNKLVIVGYF